MTTETDLRQSYRHLVQQAPSREELALRPPSGRRPARRHGGLLPVATAAIAVSAVILAVLLVVRPGSSTTGDGSRPGPGPAGPGAPPTFPTQYWFGPASLPGYTVTTLQLDAHSQSATYLYNGATDPAASVTLTGFAPTAQQLSAITALTPIPVGRAHGYYGEPRVLTNVPLDRGTPAIFWPLDRHRWIALSKNGAGTSQLLTLANSVRPTVDDRVAFVQIGYLPNNLRFSYTAQYLNQKQMLSPDGTVGTGYRTLSFTDRGLGINAHSTLDIVSVIDPFVNLTTATVDDLPSFNIFSGPWQKTTVAGHLAWVGPHDVLIKWGSIQVGVASSRTDGDTSTPLLGKAELLKIAASLTVTDSNAVGHGYALASAFPTSAFH
jgi:hypothetical protein